MVGGEGRRKEEQAAAMALAPTQAWGGPGAAAATGSPAASARFTAPELQPHVSPSVPLFPSTTLLLTLAPCWQAAFNGARLECPRLKHGWRLPVQSKGKGGRMEGRAGGETLGGGDGKKQG